MGIDEKNPQALSAELSTQFKASFAEKQEIVRQLANSTLVPKDYRNNESDLMLALNYGEMLGINFALAVTELYPINGRITTGVHIAEGLLLSRNDISYEVIEDSVPIYHYRSNGGIIKELSEKELEAAIHPEKGIYEIIRAGATPDTFTKGKLQLERVASPYMPIDQAGNQLCTDRRTTIRFIRKSKNIDITTSYTLSEAFRAGLPIEKVNTWGKYERDMMYARCLGRVSRRYGGDVIKNLFFKEEMIQYQNETEDTMYEEVQ